MFLSFPRCLQQHCGGGLPRPRPSSFPRCLLTNFGGGLFRYRHYTILAWTVIVRKLLSKPRCFIVLIITKSAINVLAVEDNNRKDKNVPIYAVMITRNDGKEYPETEELTRLNWTTTPTKSSTTMIMEATELVTTSAALKLLITAAKSTMVNPNNNNNNNNDNDHYNRVNGYDIIRVKQQQWQLQVSVNVNVRWVYFLRLYFLAQKS